MDEELQRWASAWKAGPVPALDRHVRRARLQSVLGLTLGWMVVAGMLVWTTTTGIADPRPVIQVIAAFVAIFEVGTMAWLTWTIVRVPRSTAATNAAWLAELRHRQALEVRVGHTNTPLFIVCGFVGLWTPWKLWEDRVAYAAEPWRAIVGVGGMLVILGGVLLARRHLRARAERALVDLERLAEQLRE